MTRRLEKILIRMLKPKIVGRCRWGPQELLLAYAIAHLAQEEEKEWHIWEVGSLRITNTEAIENARELASQGAWDKIRSTFELTEDAIVIFVAFPPEHDTISHARTLVIELLNPYDFQDCGEVISFRDIGTGFRLPQGAPRYVLNIEQIFGKFWLK